MLQQPNLKKKAANQSESEQKGNVKRTKQLKAKMKGQIKKFSLAKKKHQLEKTGQKTFALQKTHCYSQAELNAFVS